jgi:hypothetical protein
MSSKFPINNVYFHPELDNDLDEIAQSMESMEQLDVFLEVFDKAIKVAQKDPFKRKTDLKYELAGWNRTKFFSVKRPARKAKPDYRFIYKYDRDTCDFYKLTVGKRNADGEDEEGNAVDSPYYKSKHRDRSDDAFKKE